MGQSSSNKPHWTREDRLPDPEEIAWLQSPEGRAVCMAMAEGEPADSPAAIERWRERAPAVRVCAAWSQVLLRRAARSKFARANDMIFDRVGLEQSTDETVATYKAGRFTGADRVADLCCGIGGDSLALADGREVVAVDRSVARAAMARHNAGAYGHSIVVQTGDVGTTSPKADAAHIDPDRRVAGRRSHGIDSGSPNLRTVEQLVGMYDHAAIKLSPGADFDELPFPAEIELISHHGDCKQAVAWTGRFHQVHRRATLLPSGASIAALPGEPLEWPASSPPLPEAYLYEPDPAVIRAGLVGVLARKLNVAPVDPRIAWLVGDRPLADPLVRPFHILSVRPWSAKPARSWLAEHQIGSLEIKTRGFAASPETILKKLRFSGHRSAVLFLTRIADRPTAILAERFVP